METHYSAILATFDSLQTNPGKFKGCKFPKFLNRKMYRKIRVNRICLRLMFLVPSVPIRRLFITRCKLGPQTKRVLFFIGVFLVSLLGRITNFSYEFIMKMRSQGSLVKGLLKEGKSGSELIREVSGINVPFNYKFD